VGDNKKQIQARSKLVRRNRRHKRPFIDGKVMREVQQPGEHTGVFRAMTRG
jgi:hypothetical protein